MILECNFKTALLMTKARKKDSIDYCVISYAREFRDKEDLVKIIYSY